MEAQRWFGEAIEQADVRLADSDEADRRDLGQFFTHPAVAAFMAKVLVGGAAPSSAVILDPGAGTGTLGLTLAAELRAAGCASIKLCAVELDAVTSDHLAEALEAAERAARGALRTELRHGDFLALAEGALDQQPLPECDFVIANPPYFKVSPGVGPGGDAPNIYARFMEMAATLLQPGGRMAFIVPRSFASGLYFKRFRRSLHDRLHLEQVHVFGSRRDAFKEQAVLQENIIVFYRKGGVAPSQILISTSAGREDLDQAQTLAVPTETVFRPGDDQAVLHLPSSPADLEVMARFSQWSDRLETLGLAISTGPVVAFRAKDLLLPDDAPDALPLLWLNHVRPGRVAWPIQGFRKQQYMKRDAAAALLWPNNGCVLLRRFSAKEEERRLTAAALLPGQLPGAVVGLENHLNVIHRPRTGLTAEEATGIAAFLGSSPCDAWFRIASGSTQVNATEIRSLPFPQWDTLRAVGRLLLDAPDTATDVWEGRLYDPAG